MSLRSAPTFSTLLLASALAVAACGGSDGGTSGADVTTESAESPTTEAPTTEAPTTEAPTTESVTSEEPATEQTAPEDGSIRDLAIDEFVAVGLSEEDANCVIDVYESEGVSLEDVNAIGQGQQPTDLEAFATASGRLSECLTAEQLAEFAGDAVAQDPESARAGFIQGFVGATGATEDQAGCIFDELIAAGVERGDLAAATVSPELEAAIPGATQACGFG